MNKQTYHTMIESQEAQRNNAYIFLMRAMLSSGSKWEPLPQGIKSTLGLHSAIGVCSGMLITRTGANGSNDFINRLNNKSS